MPPTNSYLTLLKILRKNLRYIPFEGAEKFTFDSKKWSQFNQADLVTDTSTTNLNKTKSSGLISKDSFRINKNNSKQNKTTKDNSNNNNNNFNEFASQNSINNHFQENWFECWQAKNASILLNFEYHPCPILDWNKECNIYLFSL